MSDRFNKLWADRLASLDLVINENIDSLAFELFQNVAKKAFAHVFTTEAQEDVIQPNESQR